MFGIWLLGLVVFAFIGSIFLTLIEDWEDGFGPVAIIALFWPILVPVILVLGGGALVGGLIKKVFKI